MRRRGWPRFWLGGPQPFLLWGGVLRTLAAGLTRATAWRWRWATPYHVGAPLICVGNFTLGGGGKTPVVMLLANKLRRHKPAILSRGYGGRVRAPMRVAPAHRARDVGDEACMMAAMLGGEIPVYVGANRRVSARAAIAQGAQILLMDDGLQNPTLAHTLNLAVVDQAVGLGNGRVLPAGPLRRPWMQDMAHTHALLMVESAGGAHPSMRQLTQRARARHLPIFHVRRRLRRLPFARNTPLYAFCGLAQPQKFFTALAAAGWALAGEAAFPDHHVFTRRDARRLLADAAKHRARLVTTEKDMVRLQTPPLSALAKATHACGEELSVREDKKFWQFIRQRLKT